MLVAERRNQIQERVLEAGSVRADTLAKEFAVSEETIRRDLTALAKKGLIEKNYGGAVAVRDISRLLQNIPPVQQRKLENLAEKDAIGKRAAQYVRQGMRVFFDAGSTTWCLVRHLKEIQDLTVVTNSLDIAGESAQHTGWNVVVLGGSLRHKSMCMVGPRCEAELADLNVEIAFLGSSGVGLNGNCTSSDALEADCKRKAIAVAGKSILLAEAAKFGQDNLCTFANLKDFATVVSSTALGREQAALMGARNTVLAPLP